MSLKSFLDSSISKPYKNAIPNLKKAFKDIETDTEIAKSQLFCPPVEGYHPQDVGTAYDWWFRAWIQRINHERVEEGLYDNTVLTSGIKHLSYLGLIEDEAAFELLLETFWDERLQYIKGEGVAEERMATMSLLFASVEDVYRGYNRYLGAISRGESIARDFHTVREPDKQDLLQLITYTKKKETLFQKQPGSVMHLNPVVGTAMNRAVGGADGDLILNNAFIDLKTVKDSGYSSKHVQQMLSYYLMSQENDEYRGKIRSIGFYYARYTKLYIADIQDIQDIFLQHGTSFDSIKEMFFDCFR